jgi:glycosyltransferase involved in cell wall biosynthesis
LSCIVYFGTYEAAYPRNRTMIARLREEGHEVVECHASLLDDAEHKTGLVRSPRSLARLGARAARAYGDLARRLLREHARADEIMVGYIGQLDALVAWPLARLRGQRLRFNPLVSLHDTLVSDRRLFGARSVPAGVLWLLDWLALRAADEVLIDTEAHRRFLIAEFGLDPRKVNVVYVEAEPHFRPLEVPRRPEDEGRFVVLFYGKLIPLHGLDRVLRAQALIEARRDAPCERIHLRVVGSGQLGEELHALARSLRLRRLEWVDWVPYDELPHVIAESDLCLGAFGASDKASRVIPNKVWQCLACNRRVVSQRLQVPETHPLLAQLVEVEPTPEAIAGAIVREAQRAQAGPGA